MICFIFHFYFSLQPILKYYNPALKLSVSEAHLPIVKETYHSAKDFSYHGPLTDRVLRRVVVTVRNEATRRYHNCRDGHGDLQPPAAHIPWHPHRLKKNFMSGAIS